MACTTKIGFPIKNDGALQYNEEKQRYELPFEKLMLLASCINRCTQAWGVGRVKDDRRKKHPGSLSKDRTFIEETGRGKFDDFGDLAKIIFAAMQYGTFQKCDVNHNKEKGEIDYDNAKLIFAYTVNGRKIDLQTDRETYVKISFTRTGKGIYLHLESLHF